VMLGSAVDCVHRRFRAKPPGVDSLHAPGMKCDMPSVPPICQVAFSAVDARTLLSWYQSAFGLLPSGTTLFGGPLATRVQGIERNLSVCRWLVDSQDFFQLEFFSFVSPKTRKRPTHDRLCDLGYRMIGIHVSDFEATMARLRKLRSVPRTIGEAPSRMACVRDPEGNWVEIFERDPLAGRAPEKARADLTATVRSVTLSVPDLDAASKIWIEGFGLPNASEPLHGVEHEALWGLTGARREAKVVQAGGVLLELVEYQAPEPARHPPDYQISDQGIMNIALGFSSAAEFDAFYDRAVAIGCRPNGEPLDIGVFKVMYVNEPVGGESVELLCARRRAFGIAGFSPRSRRVPRLHDQWRTALITGAGSGIGLQLAEDLAKNGTSLVLMDLDIPADALERVRETRREASQIVEAIKVDVADDAAVDRAVDRAMSMMPTLDLVIHSAGIQIAKPFEELTPEEYRRVIDVNLIGSRNVAAALLPRLEPGARFAFISSLGGLIPNYSYAAYAASKYGVIGLAGTLRLEYEPRGIHISVICPPEVDTPMVIDERRTMHPANKALKELAGRLSVETAARRILYGLARGDFLVIPGGRARFAYALERFLPQTMAHRITDLFVRRGLREVHHDEQ
jgi:NAD(P)-dependent dehydrogenase (short-subunit alcohol dehydrogenase family)/catechol 2,3-dioxygenase-like lactoylglutathione lyase family enzyme